MKMMLVMLNTAVPAVWAQVCLIPCVSDHAASIRRSSQSRENAVHGNLQAELTWHQPVNRFKDGELGECRHTKVLGYGAWLSGCEALVNRIRNPAAPQYMNSSQPAPLQNMATSKQVICTPNVLTVCSSHLGTSRKFGPDEWLIKFTAPFRTIAPAKGGSTSRCSAPFTTSTN